MDEEKQQNFYRTVKTFVLRQGRMTERQQRDYEELSEQWCINYIEEKLDFGIVFGNINPVTVEIGFGMGAATAIIAEQNPDKNYIGIEVHKPGVGKLLGEIKRKNLANLRIIQHDALEVLQNMIPVSSVAAFQA